MPSPQSEPAAPETEATPPAPVSDTPTVAELASKVDRILDMLAGSHSEAEAPEEDAKSIAQREARAAVQDLQRKEQARQKREREAGELQALKDKVDKITEKAPEEYRKVEGFMRWRDPKKRP